MNNVPVFHFHLSFVLMCHHAVTQTPHLLFHEYHIPPHSNHISLLTHKLATYFLVLMNLDLDVQSFLSLVITWISSHQSLSSLDHLAPMDGEQPSKKKLCLNTPRQAHTPLFHMVYVHQNHLNN